MSGQKQAKMLLSGSPKLAKMALSFGNEEFELLAGFLTGHSALKNQLRKLGNTEIQNENSGLILSFIKSLQLTPRR